MVSIPETAAALQPRLWPSVTSVAHGLNATITAGPNPTIAEYDTALNGVNQHMNNLFRIALWWSLGVLAMLILVTRLCQRLYFHFRHLQSMNLSAGQQRYWSLHRQSWLWKFKKYVLYAPLFSKRHNREMRLSSALNMGTIPSRFHTSLLVLFYLSNLGYCLALHYTQKDHYALFAELRGRSGVLGVINMIALVIFAGRNNPLIHLLQISFDTYNLFHRWIGRLIVIEIIIHTCCWSYVKHAATGFAGMWRAMKTDPFIGWGSVGTISFVLIIILSLSPLRHAFYETFLNVHIILAILAILGTWIHCDVAHLPQLPYVKVVLTLWIADRVFRFARLVWYNYHFNSHTTTRATIVALPSEATRVTLHLPKRVLINPGSHAYLRFASIKPWESHPFSIAWAQDRICPLSTLPLNDLKKEFEETGPQEALHAFQDPNATTDISFVIQAQTGFTRALYNRALSVSPRELTLSAVFEGPYGGHHSLSSYGTVVLFAGSSGITHQIPFLTQLIHGYSTRTTATRKILLVWIVRDQECMQWVQEWMDAILQMRGRREVLRIKVFVTRPKRAEEVRSASRTVEMFPGRPNVEMLVRDEAERQVGAMAVTVCGPGGLADNVRAAVRGVQEGGVVDFLEESFTW